MNEHSITLQELARALGGKVTGKQVLAPGPGHSATDASLAVTLAPGSPDGFVVHSFAGDPFDLCKDHVRERLGLGSFAPAVVEKPKSGPVAEYVYRQADGSPHQKVTRWPQRDGRKGFSQSFWFGGEWVNRKPIGYEPVPYRLPEMLAAVHDTVFICEGEKDADRLAALGFVATTCPEGAGKWHQALNKHFRDKTCFILEDNDEAGRKHCRQVAEALRPVARLAKIIALPGLPEKGDVSDWLDAGNDHAGLVDLCERHVADREPALAGVISATPFQWADPAALPQREWLYGRFLIRRYVSLTIAPGGAGKSSLTIAEALAMAAGRQLLHDVPYGRSRVWLWNGEDPQDELQRRILAAAIHHGIDRLEVEGSLFVNTGRETEIILADMDKGNVRIAVPVVDAMVATIRENKIDVVVIDPFVSSHGVPENDNGAIDRVAKTWARIAHETGCAVHLVHHARKTGGAEVEVEHSRGAVALIGAARAARTINTMTAEEAERAGVDGRRSFIRVDDGKANLAPMSDGAKWLKIESVPLRNGPLGAIGDEVGVVTPWQWPDPLSDVTAADLLRVQTAVSAEPWRKDHQAKRWVGHAVAKALGLDTETPADRTKIKGLLRIWIASGALKEVEGLDEKRNSRTFVEVGEWATN